MAIRISQKLLAELERRVNAEFLIEVEPGSIHVWASRKIGPRTIEIHSLYYPNEWSTVAKYQTEQIKTFWAKLAADFRKRLDEREDVS